MPWPLACALLTGLWLVARPAAAADLRLERVWLSSAGIVLLDHAAEVGPEAELELVVPRSQVDDLLKSLTVYDSAGLAGAVTLAGEAPTADLFRDLPIQAINWHDQETPPSLREALGRFPGAILGGLNRLETVVRGDPDEVIAQARAAIREAARQMGAAGERVERQALVEETLAQLQEGREQIAQAGVVADRHHRRR